MDKSYDEICSHSLPDRSLGEESGQLSVGLWRWHGAEAEESTGRKEAEKTGVTERGNMLSCVFCSQVTEPGSNAWLKCLRVQDPSCG